MDEKQFLINEKDLNGITNYICGLPFRMAKPLIDTLNKVLLPFDPPKQCDCKKDKLIEEVINVNQKDNSKT